MKDKIVTLVYSLGVGGGLGMVIGSWGFLAAECGITSVGREFYDYLKNSPINKKWFTTYKNLKTP